ncbi:hypothetical protein [Novosphingobium arvoryzae]|uniref:hypothetical protein n=1 Tax=Novosphingobium arvoryzae TaxID=1256514 RepID=UPI0035B0893B
MPIIMRIAGALLLAYFISRVTLRLPNRWRRFQGLFYAHFLAWLICCLVIIAARLPLGVFSLRQTVILAAAQIVWLSVDQLRRNYPERYLARR